MGVFVVANPARPQAAAAVDALTRRAAVLTLPQPTVSWTTATDPGAAATREAVAAGAEVVVACGGDGTIRQVAGALAGTGIEMGILPVGRGNVLAHNLGLSGLAKLVVVEIALQGCTATVGVGRAWLTLSGGAVREEPFLCMVGIGHDATAIGVMREVAGWQGYFVAGARRLLEPAGEHTISVDGAPAERIRAWSVFVGNQPRVPPGLELFPGAGGPDGGLVVASVRPGSLPGWGLIALGRLRHAASNHRYRYRSASRVLVRPAQPAAVQLDGDVIGGVSSLVAVGGTRFLGIRSRLGVPLG